MLPQIKSEHIQNIALAAPYCGKMLLFRDENKQDIVAVSAEGSEVFLFGNLPDLGGECEVRADILEGELFLTGKK